MNVRVRVDIRPTRRLSLRLRSSPYDGRVRLIIPACLTVVALLGVDVWKDVSAQEAAPRASTRAIVVEAVEQGSAGQKAGILPGDLLTSWERAASPPANPTAVRGNFDSPFDLGELEAE